MTTITTTPATDERTIRLILEVTREVDDSFSVSLEDGQFPESSDERYPTGLTEGYVFDPAEIADDAASLVLDYLLNGARRTAEETGAIYRIAVPMDFKESDQQG